LLPLIDSGGNRSGKVVLRLIDLFVRFELRLVTLGFSHPKPLPSESNA